MARGKLLQTRCKKGFRRNKKTKKCNRKLNPNAETFRPKRSSASLKKSFTKGIKTAESIPKKAISGIITGVEDVTMTGISTLGKLDKKVLKNLPKTKKKKSRKKGSKGKSRNPWMVHLSAHRKKNPGRSLKSAMKEAKKSYKKGG